MLADVVLVTGPLGAGKSTLAARLGARLERPVISEDDHWAAHGWTGGRKPEQESIIQREVLDLLAIEDRAIVEFILYRHAPGPLTVYEDALAARGVSTQSVLVQVEPDEAHRRMLRRGRQNDMDDRATRLSDIVFQATVLEAAAPQRIVIDTTCLDADGVCDEALRRLSS